MVTQKTGLYFIPQQWRKFPFLPETISERIVAEYNFKRICLNITFEDCIFLCAKDKNLMLPICFFIGLLIYSRLPN